MARGRRRHRRSGDSLLLSVAGGDLSTEEVIWAGYFNFSLNTRWEYWGHRIEEEAVAAFYSALKISFWIES